MTTKVKIEIVQPHMPVVVDILRGDGTVQYWQTIQFGDTCTEYVHSGQMLRVREMTTEEQHDVGMATTSVKCEHLWKVTSHRLQGMWSKCEKCGAMKEETWD